MENRSEDDRPSSALNREIRPESEKCPDWSLIGGSDSETHTFTIYQWMCVNRCTGSRQNTRDTLQCNATLYNLNNYDPKLQQCLDVIAFKDIIYCRQISLCCAGVLKSTCAFSVFQYKLLVRGYNSTCWIKLLWKSQCWYMWENQTKY